MLIDSHAIVLSKLKYKDYDLIVRCYTLHRGTVSYLVKGGLKNTKSRASKSIYFQPLSQIQIIENFREGQSLQYFKEVKAGYIYKTLHTNVYKSAIVLFLSEVLNSALKEEERNLELYEFIEHAFKYLDDESNFSNFHLLFLLKLTRYLGFQPEKPSKNSNYFNLLKGYFEATSSDIYSISGKNLTLLKTFLGINFDAINEVKLASTERQDFLNMLLYYFELHLGNFKKLKSLKILNDVFH
ncbi:DNA repair protein RecO [Winogradskyella sp. A3E31]|uniref:DNA repair protein RecO n=1 Tax=Winogradskyella sp. A3E31 TaxID=3349637 RepID=UPI00398A80C4